MEILAGLHWIRSLLTIECRAILHCQCFPVQGHASASHPCERRTLLFCTSCYFAPFAHWLRKYAGIESYLPHLHQTRRIASCDLQSLRHITWYQVSVAPHACSFVEGWWLERKTNRSMKSGFLALQQSKSQHTSLDHQAIAPVLCLFVKYWTFRLLASSHDLHLLARLCVICAEFSSF